ncbi:MAG TPA: hypothetical protein VFK79_08055 [Xanthobacteraceae bacterium]|nr:hypothetical protein [Xanthobacteraceae bacterium]
MTIIIGVAFVVLGAAAFIYSLPRGGRVARFVGTNWEGYAVVMMISLLAVGLVMIISGIAEVAQ